MVKTTVSAQKVIDYVEQETFTSDKIKTFIYGVATQNKANRENCFNNNLTDLRTDSIVTNRDQFFDSQVCIQNGDIITTIASFDSIEKSLNFMKATYNPLGPIADAIDNELQVTSTVDTLPKTLTILYMSNVYSNPPIVGNGSQIISSVENKINSDEKFKTSYDKWLGIFKSVVQRGDI